jgi:hypothetical protein
MRTSGRQWRPHVAVSSLTRLQGAAETTNRRKRGSFRILRRLQYWNAGW